MDWKYLLPLTLFMTIYLLVGAVIFQALESPDEWRRRRELQDYIADFLDNHPYVNQTTLHKMLVKVTENGDLMRRMVHDIGDTIWDFTGAFGFAVTVVTTIGYGHLSPSTSASRAVCVVYAIVGIPFTLLLLNGLSTKLHGIAVRISLLRVCPSQPKANRLANCVLIVSLGLFFMFLMPTATFMHMEGWTFTEGLYYCFITLSTIGFGDYIAGIYEPEAADNMIDVYKIAIFTWVLFGLAYLTLVIKFLTNLIVESVERVENKTRQVLEKEISRLQEQIDCHKESLAKWEHLYCEKLNRADTALSKCWQRSLRLCGRKEIIGKNVSNTVLETACSTKKTEKILHEEADGSVENFV